MHNFTKVKSIKTAFFTFYYYYFSFIYKFIYFKFILPGPGLLSVCLSPHRQNTLGVTSIHL